MNMTLVGAGYVFDMAEMKLPDRFVLWEVHWGIEYNPGASCDIGIAMGERAPANVAEFNGMEMLLPEITSRMNGKGWRNTFYIPPSPIVNIRKLVPAQGRRLIGAGVRVLTASTAAVATIVISSIPREVPDWLVSGQGKNL